MLEVTLRGKESVPDAKSYGIALSKNGVLAMGI